MLIYVQFGIIHNLQMSPIPQTSFLVGTFFAVSYSKPAQADIIQEFFSNFRIKPYANWMVNIIFLL